jgi:hypothetical protein
MKCNPLAMQTCSCLWVDLGSTGRRKNVRRLDCHDRSRGARMANRSSSVFSTETVVVIFQLLEAKACEQCVETIKLFFSLLFASRKRLVGYR